MLKLLSKISLVILLALMLSAGVDYFYRQAYKLNYEWPKNILILPEIAEKYELVKLGNSHSEDGLTFGKYNVKSLGLATVAQTFEYDLALLKMHSRQIKKGAVIIINVSPISFSQNKPDKEENVNMQYYDGRLSPFLIPQFKLSDYIQIQLLPFVRSGYLWRTNYAREKEEKAMNTFAEKWEKPPIKKTIQAAAPVLSIAPIEPSGPVELIRTDRPSFNVSKIQAELNAPPDPSNEKLVDSSRRMVDKWYTSGGFDNKNFDANKKDLQDIIDYCREHNWRPVLITLPISQVLLDKLEPGYLKRYVYDNLKEMDLHDIEYFNFASNIQLTKSKFLFGNSDHLNKKGAAIASYLLLRELINIGYLPKNADKYDYSPGKGIYY